MIGLTGPGKVTKREHVLNFSGRWGLIEDPPAPVLTRCRAGELYPVTPTIFAVHVEEEQVALLQLVNQPKRNVDKSSLITNIQSRKQDTSLEQGLFIVKVIDIYIYIDVNRL